MALEQGTIPEGSELSACRVVLSQTCPEPVEGWEGIVLISILCEKGLSLVSSQKMGERNRESRMLCEMRRGE